MAGFSVLAASTLFGRIDAHRLGGDLIVSHGEKTVEDEIDSRNFSLTARVGETKRKRILSAGF